MVRIDIKDKDPFANTDAKPKDDISTWGFIFRAGIRYLKIFIFFYAIAAIIYYYVFGTLPRIENIPGL